MVSPLVEIQPASTGQPSVPRVPVEVLAPCRDIRTPRLTLRPLRPGDRSQFVGILRTDEAYLHRGINVRVVGETLDDCFERLLRATVKGDMSGLEWRRVGVLDDDRIAGMFHLLAIDHALLAKADAGWWVTRQCAGNGLAIEGVQAMVQYAFDDLAKGLGLIQVDAAITADNLASRRVAERAGFVCCAGERTQCRLEGRFVDHEIWHIKIKI